MSTKQVSISLVIILVLAAAGNVLWLYEIISVYTWQSTGWLYGRLYSPFVDTLLVVLCFITPFVVAKKYRSAAKLLWSVVALYSVSIVCYRSGENWCRAASSRLIFLAGDPRTVYLYIALYSLATFLFLGFGYWLITHLLIKRCKKKNMLLIFLLSLLVVPLSTFSANFYMWFGGTEISWVQAVKMGYPVFWMGMLLGICGVLIAQQKEISVHR